MTKEEFAKMEKICKDAWIECSITGNDKPISVIEFRNRCPACEIAKVLEDDGETQDCRLCPITKWRKMASDRSGFHIGDAVCEWPGEPYYEWIECKDFSIRKKAAKEISEQEWSFTDCHEKVKLPKHILDILEGVDNADI